MHWTPLMIIFWMCLAIYKRLARGEKNPVQEGNRDAALNLARECYGDKNF